MKRIIFLVGSYFPNFSAVGRCAGNVAELLAKDYAVTVISMKTRSDEPAQEILNGQNLIRIATPGAERRLKILQKLETGKGMMRFFAKLSHYVWRIKNTMRILLGRDSLDRKLVAKFSQALNAVDEPDAIIPVCMPYEAVVAGVAYKKIHPNVKLIPYLFDKFSVNRSLHRSKFNKKLKLKRHLALEKKMVAAADKLVFVESWSEHLARYFSEFSDKFILTEHPLLKETSGPSAETEKKESVSIVYTGTIVQGVRSPDTFLQVVTSLLVKTDIIVHFYVVGNEVAEIKRICALYPERIFNHGAVASQVAQKAMIEADVLLSLGNRDITQLPSKIFEYMANGKPIIHTFWQEYDPAVGLLKQYPLCYLMEEGSTNIQAKQDGLRLFLNEKAKLKLNFDEVAALFPTARPGYTADIMKNMIEG